MAAGRDWLFQDQPTERDWLILDPQPCAHCLELKAEGERLRAALERCNRERNAMFWEIFRLEVLSARRAPGIGKPSKAKAESIVRQARRTRNRTDGAPDALRWFLQQVKGGKGREGLLRALCKKRADI